MCLESQCFVLVLFDGPKPAHHLLVNMLRLQPAQPPFAAKAEFEK
jgi:hypothetical protein